MLDSWCVIFTVIKEESPLSLLQSCARSTRAVPMDFSSALLSNGATFKSLEWILVDLTWYVRC